MAGRLGDLDGEVDRETEGVVQHEGGLAGELLALAQGDVYKRQRTKSPFSTTRSLEMACGLAVLGPDATMEPKARSSAP